jgi:hypothetical protein
LNASDACPETVLVDGFYWTGFLTERPLLNVFKKRRRFLLLVQG